MSSSPAADRPAWGLALIGNKLCCRQRQRLRQGLELRPQFRARRPGGGRHCRPDRRQPAWPGRSRARLSPLRRGELAGGRKGLGDEAWAFLGLMQGLRAEGRAPRMITIENVPDMLTSRRGADFDRTCEMSSPPPATFTAR